MSESHGSEHHSGLTLQAYLVVFGALSIFTAVSFAANHYIGRNLQSFGIILAVAVVKAILVGVYFMHLKVDWPKLYFLIFPTFILAAMFMVVLLPDIVLAWQ